MKDIAEQVTQTVNERLAKRADRESDSKTPFIIAIDGRCCAGKTTLAAKLKEQNGWSVFHMDDFFLQPKQRTKERLAQPGGNVDYERFSEEILTPLKNAGYVEDRNGAKTDITRKITFRPFDCHRQDFAEEVTTEARAVVLVEGSYSCHPALRDAYDLRVFLDVAQAEQEKRILARNGRDGAAVFREKWIPLEEYYFEECRIRDCCDACFP